MGAENSYFGKRNIDGIKLYGATDLPERPDAYQRDLGRLQQGPGERHEVQQIQVQRLATGLWQPPLPVQARGQMDGTQPCQKGPVGVSRGGLQNDPRDGITPSPRTN